MQRNSSKVTALEISHSLGTAWRCIRPSQPSTGRVLSTAAIARLSDANSADELSPAMLLRLDQQMVDPVINALKKFIVFSKASITDKSDILSCYATRLPSDRDVLTFSAEDQEGEIWTSESLDAPIIDGGWTARALRRGLLWTTD